MRGAAAAAPRESDADDDAVDSAADENDDSTCPPIEGVPSAPSGFSPAALAPGEGWPSGKGGGGAEEGVTGLPPSSVASSSCCCWWCRCRCCCCCDAVRSSGAMGLLDIAPIRIIHKTFGSEARGPAQGAPETCPRYFTAPSGGTRSDGPETKLVAQGCGRVTSTFRVDPHHEAQKHACKKNSEKPGWGK